MHRPPNGLSLDIVPALNQPSELLNRHRAEGFKMVGDDARAGVGVDVGCPVPFVVGVFAGAAGWGSVDQMALVGCEGATGHERLHELRTLLAVLLAMCVGTIQGPCVTILAQPRWLAAQFAPAVASHGSRGRGNNQIFPQHGARTHPMVPCGCVADAAQVNTVAGE